MKITLVNFKRGVGKSMIAHQLITSYDFCGIEIDPYGSLSNRLGEQVQKVRLGAKELPAFPDRTIVDFGAFKDPKILRAAEQSDLVMIPFMLTLESMMATVETLEYVAPTETPILFVANMVQNPEDIRQASHVFEEVLGGEPEIYALPLSMGLQSALNLNRSIIELANENSPRAQGYRKSAKQFEGLYAKIVGYRQPDLFRCAS